VDVFEGTLRGLLLAEAEFESAAAADALTIPSFIAREVTDDERFTGGRLIHASNQEVRAWLSEYGLGVAS
jgi:CYTH domain-containing protein